MKRMVKNQKPAMLAPVPSGDKLKWVKQGDQIGKFKVVEIKNDSILLTAEGMDFSVFLYEKRGQKGVAPSKKETGPVVVSVGPSATKNVPAPAPVKTAPPIQADLMKNIQKALKPKNNVPAPNATTKNTELKTK